MDIVLLVGGHSISHVGAWRIIGCDWTYGAGFEAVSGWGPGFDLGQKYVYFKDQNSDTQIFGLITKM